MPTVVRTLAVFCLVGAAAPARAELVFFDTGRSMSVKSHRIDGESLILALRGGGEVTCDRSVITKIEPDEVPYPEPAVEVDVRPKPDATGVDAMGSAAAARARYGDMIDKVAARHGVDARLVKAVIQVESAFRERATSRKGAMGLMQIMPETAKQYAVADPYDARSNIEAGIKHLKSLLDRYPRALALAAYNAGEAAVQRFGGVPPYAETRDYVSRILKLVGH